MGKVTIGMWNESDAICLILNLTTGVMKIVLPVSARTLFDVVIEWSRLFDYQFLHRLSLNENSSKENSVVQ